MSSNIAKSNSTTAATNAAVSADHTTVTTASNSGVNAPTNKAAATATATATPSDPVPVAANSVTPTDPTDPKILGMDKNMIVAVSVSVVGVLLALMTRSMMIGLAVIIGDLVWHGVMTKVDPEHDTTPHLLLGLFGVVMILVAALSGSSGNKKSS